MFFKKKNKKVEEPTLYGQLFSDCPKVKDGTPRAIALKNLFEGKVCGEVINDTIYIAYEMNADNGLAILGATANYDFSVHYLKDFDDETKFWLAACTLRFVKGGYSGHLDETRDIAKAIIDDYSDDFLKTKILLLM